MSGSTPNEFMYRGEQYDSDLGLYYLRARYYNPATGRFMSRDPENGILTDPKTLHKYLYAGGDPMNYRDPSGRDVMEIALPLSRVSASSLTMAGEMAEAAAVSCVFNKAATTLESLAENAGRVPIQVINLPCATKFKYDKCADPDEDAHHMLPQQFEKWFNTCGIPNIHDSQYMRCVPSDCHTGPGGLHSNQNGPGTNWNARWAQFITRQNGTCPSIQEIIGFMDQLEQEFAQQFICAGEEE